MQVVKIPLIGTQYKLAEVNQLEEIISGNMESLIDINQNLGVLTDYESLAVVTPPAQNPFGQQPDFAKNFNHV